jgi:hypothetical protein
MVAGNAATASVPGRRAAPASGTRRRLTRYVAAAAGLAWVPFMTKPVSPDEGGFLLVAAQWQPGGSLYGHYWVDRPPLLITIFDVASYLGGATALRLIGMGAVVVSVALAGRIARRAAGRPAIAPLVLAAVLLANPLFGATMVDGELLAVPFVLASTLALIQAWSSPALVSAGWSVLAGVAAAAAPLVKQNVLDGFVVSGVVVVMGLLTGERRRVAVIGICVAAGATLMVALCVVWAETRGTEPLSLWRAVVAFRAQAVGVIDASPDTSSVRLVQLLWSAFLSGAPFVVAVLVIRVRRPLDVRSGTPDLRLPALALLGWELVAVGLGGSYWLHYLIGLVPGLVLLAVAAEQRAPSLRRWAAAALVIAGISSTTATVTAAVDMAGATADTAVAAYLRSHGTAADTAVVGFGHPDILWEAGLRSPYSQLWSLPVRVRDPRLRHLAQILSGRRAPTWVVVSGRSLGTWGIDATAAQHVLDVRYRPVTAIAPYVVWRLE